MTALYAAIGVAALGAGVAAYLGATAPKAEAPLAIEPANKKLALYCQFYVFVESRPFVAFLLEQAAGDAATYRQVYVAKADGDRTDYNALADTTPEWRFDHAGDPPRLAGRVIVPDSSQAGLGEQDIAIELRDFDAARADGAWRESSLKSAYYQNLPGKCRQASVTDPVQRPEG